MADADQLAEELAAMDIKRSTTLSDLEAIEETSASIKRRVEQHPSRQATMMQEFIVALDRDDIEEEQRQELYRDWHQSIKSSIDEFNSLTAELERLKIQEVILTRIVREIDRKIEGLRTQLDDGI
ncbi:MAG: hypothetical protein GYB68_05360 [Chloroflexi bacterium]|nr:hypothetical protein [Chloroflexota bacterium]